MSWHLRDTSCMSITLLEVYVFICYMFLPVSFSPWQLANINVFNTIIKVSILFRIDIEITGGGGEQ